MKLLKILFFVGLIYGVSSRDFFPGLNPIIRALLEASRELINKWGVSVIESQRDNIKTGFPAIGIPPLDPLRIDTIDLPLGITNLTLKEADLRGLSEFNIEYFDLKLFGLSFAFTVHFDTLEIVGKHVTKTKVGFISHEGKGDIVVILQNVVIFGIIELDVTNRNTLTLKTLAPDFGVDKVQVYMTGFLIPALNSTISGIVADALKLVINSGDFFIKLIKETLTTPINMALDKITLSDVLVSVIQFIMQFNH